MSQSSTNPATHYRVLWKVLVRQPSGLEHWIYLRAPSEAEALATMRRARPLARMLKVERVQSPA